MPKNIAKAKSEPTILYQKPNIFSFQVQLLPSSISKRIMSFLPRAQLAEYARVNKYWSYLVDEFKAELAARLKIDVDYEKLHVSKENNN